MEKTLLGIIQVDPRKILEDGLRKELVRKISEVGSKNAVAREEEKERERKAHSTTLIMFFFLFLLSYLPTDFYDNLQVMHEFVVLLFIAIYLPTAVIYTYRPCMKSWSSATVGRGRM